STRYPGASERWRKEIAGCQYAAADDGSALERARLHASGERFQEQARPTATTATGHGRQRRTAIGSAAYRSRAAFSPTSEGTAYAIRQTAAYAAKSARRIRARSTRHVRPRP